MLLITPPKIIEQARAVEIQTQDSLTSKAINITTILHYTNIHSTALSPLTRDSDCLSKN
jgi:hypothetical protein